MAGPFYSAGNYHVQIIDVALGESKTREDGGGGNPQIVMKVKVISELTIDSAGEEQAVGIAAQYDRTIYLTVTDKSKEMVLAKLRLAGWTGDHFETVAAELLGHGCRANCKIESGKGGKYDGQQVEKWDLELPPLESKPLENKPAVAKKLNALFGKMLKEKPTTATKPEAVPVVVGEQPPNDEIPF